MVYAIANFKWMKNTHIVLMYNCCFFKRFTRAYFIHFSPEFCCEKIVWHWEVCGPTVVWLDSCLPEGNVLDWWSKGPGVESSPGDLNLLGNFIFSSFYWGCLGSAWTVNNIHHTCLIICLLHVFLTCIHLFSKSQSAVITDSCPYHPLFHWRCAGECYFLQK